MTLNGPDFNLDNTTVYVFLSGFLTESPGWNLIKKFDKTSDGRKYWIALKKHYEGSSFDNNTKDKAFISLIRS